MDRSQSTAGGCDVLDDSSDLLLRSRPAATPRDLAELQRIYASLYLIRRVEEEIIRLYPTDKIKSPVHLSIGQEAVAVAVCDALQGGDLMFATYRGHAAYLAKGGDLDRMWAELYGKANGCGRGKAGSMHLVDPAANVMGTSAIVASSLPNAVGAALAMKMQGRDAIAVCMFGEGATDEGVFHESLNFASLHALPILFVCENNQYAIYSHVSARMAGDGLCPRVATYGISAERCDSGDVFEMAALARRSVAAVRSRDGPKFIEITTSRWRDHVGPGEDRQYNYRCSSALDREIANDQVARVAGLLPAGPRAAIEQAVEGRIAAAIAWAESGAFPDNQEVFDHVFAA